MHAIILAHSSLPGTSSLLKVMSPNEVLVALEEAGGGELEYAAVRGNVACIGKSRRLPPLLALPLPCECAAVAVLKSPIFPFRLLLLPRTGDVLHTNHADPPLSCVMHNVEVREHRDVWRKGAGFEKGKWAHTTKTLSTHMRICDGIQLADGTGAGACAVNLPDLTFSKGKMLVKVFDLYQPTSSLSFKAIGGYFGGDVIKGHQTIESVLPIGSTVTAVGRIIVRPTAAEGLKATGADLIHPKGDNPFVVTYSTLEELVDAETITEANLRLAGKVLLAMSVAVGVYLLHQLVQARRAAAALHQREDSRDDGEAAGAFCIRDNPAARCCRRERCQGHGGLEPQIPSTYSEGQGVGPQERPDHASAGRVSQGYAVLC